MSLQWVPFSSRHILPSNAIEGGYDKDGSTLYVIRAQHGRAMIPGKFSYSRGSAYIPYGTKELKKTEFEILTGNGFLWKKDSGGHVPTDAFEGGPNQVGDILYIGRAAINNTITPGKILPCHQTAYISFGGKEHKAETYEVLCLAATPTPEASSSPSSSGEGRFTYINIYS